MNGQFQPSALAKRLMDLPAHDSRVDGPTVISMGRGDPQFEPSSMIIDAARAAISDGSSHYGDFGGDPELRAYIAANSSARSGVTLAPEQVVVTAGSTAGLASTVAALVNQGDQVVLLDPTYGAYSDLVHLAGGVVTRVPFLGDGHLDIPALGAAARTAALVILCHPSSPTGVVFTRTELTALGKALDDSHAILLADEAYAEIVYDDMEFTSTLDIPGLVPRLVVCRTLSKAYAMAGWRLGYLIAAPALAESIGLVHQTYNLSVNTVAQRAALAALRAGRAAYSTLLETCARNRDLVMTWVNQRGLVQARRPEATFYVFARYPQSAPSVDMARHLLNHGVRVMPGFPDGPGGEHHLRICFASPTAVVEEGLLRIERGLKSYAG